MHIRGMALFAVLAILAFAPGCTQRFRPPPVQPVARAESQPATVDVSRYLRAARLGRWVYRREGKSSQDGSPSRHVVSITDVRLAEGRLEGRSLRPIRTILDEAAATPESGPRLATEFFEGANGYFFELDQPLASIPPELQPGTPVTDTTGMEVWNRHGRRFDRGRLTRTAEIEGFEDVECPAGRFENCLRVRISLEAEFTWGPHVTLTNYTWLSEQAGEVRRVQAVTGWFWIFRFESGFEQQLLSHQSTPASAAPSDVPRWSRGAFLSLRARFRVRMWRAWSWSLRSPRGRTRCRRAMQSKGVALFGGSFNPIHVGHLISARAVAEQLKVQQVILIPSANPPHKLRSPDLADAAHRLEMARLSVAGDRLFEVSDVEIQREGPSYTILTVEHYRQALPTGTPLYWIIGADSLPELASWYRIRQLVDCCQVVTAVRPGYECPDLSGLEAALGVERVERLQSGVLATPRIDISATDIRRRVRAGLPIRYMVHEHVEEYISSRKIYRD